MFGTSHACWSGSDGMRRRILHFYRSMMDRGRCCTGRIAGCDCHGLDIFRHERSYLCQSLGAVFGLDERLPRLQRALFGIEFCMLVPSRHDVLILKTRAYFSKVSPQSILFANEIHKCSPQRPHLPNFVVIPMFFYGPGALPPLTP